MGKDIPQKPFMSALISFPIWDGGPTKLGMRIWNPMGPEARLHLQLCTRHNLDSAWHRLRISVAVTMFHLARWVQGTAACITLWNYLSRPREFLQKIPAVRFIPRIQNRLWRDDFSILSSGCIQYFFFPLKSLTVAYLDHSHWLSEGGRNGHVKGQKARTKAGVTWQGRPNSSAFQVNGNVCPRIPCSPAMEGLT